MIWEQEHQLRERIRALEARVTELEGALQNLVDLVEMDDDFNNPTQTDCYVALRRARAALATKPGGGAWD